MPEVIARIADLRTKLGQVRRRGASVGLVPTMGALHAGHARLLEIARRENDFVVATIFVNPIQFDRKEDLDSYPRTMGDDARVCDDNGVDLIFAPPEQELYPSAQLTFVDSPMLSLHLCGAHRTGHFRGVATVVLKLFNIVQPDRAYFGQKDAQQLAVIRRMVADLNVPVAVVPVATVREPDGLALSSRNKHLTPRERKIAPALARALMAAIDSIEKGERDAQVITGHAVAVLAQYPEVRVEYLDIADPDTLELVQRVEAPVLIASAVWLGSTRLIDNISWPAPSPVMAEADFGQRTADSPAAPPVSA